MMREGRRVVTLLTAAAIQIPLFHLSEHPFEDSSPAIPYSTLDLPLIPSSAPLRPVPLVIIFVHFSIGVRGIWHAFSASSLPFLPCILVRGGSGPSGRFGFQGSRGFR